MIRLPRARQASRGAQDTTTVTLPPLGAEFRVDTDSPMQSGVMVKVSTAVFAGTPRKNQLPVSITFSQHITVARTRGKGRRIAGGS
jgi:hypothetical protein